MEILECYCLLCYLTWKAENEKMLDFLHICPQKSEVFCTMFQKNKQIFSLLEI